MGQSIATHRDGTYQCYVDDALDDAFYREQVDQVVQRMDGLDDIDFDIAAVNDADSCQNIADTLGIDDVDAFIGNCRDALTSISYRSKGQEVIVIKADKPFLDENGEALRGLIAHELMHIVHRHSGVEDNIQDAAKAHADESVDALREMGLSQEQTARFINTVFATSIFCLKDIHANTELIKQSFTPELEEYYYNILGIGDYCRVPDFYGEEATVADVQDAIAFELGLLPAWLPFKTLNRAASNTIRRRIQECYERDIPDVAAHIHPVTDLYTKHHGNMETFHHRFFENVLNSSYDVIQAKVLD